MIEKDKEGLTQRMITEIAGVSPSTVSKFITKQNYKNIDTGNHRVVRYNTDVAREIIKNLSKNFILPKLKKHCFYNFKGGTGKTSVCFQISSLISLMGYKVLVIDLDPQGHLSSAFGLSTDEKVSTMYDKIVNNVNTKNLVHRINEGLDCIPSNLSLSRVEQYLSSAPNREKLLSKALGELDHLYDFIFIDMNPSINFLNWNVITYSDVIDIVTETQPFSINSIKLLLEELKNFYNVMDLPERRVHIIPNKYEDRASSSAESMTLLARYYSKYIKSDFAIRKSEEINTSAKLGKPLIYFSKKNSLAFSDFFEIAKYIVEISS